MSKQPINSKYDLEQILDETEYKVVRKILFLFNESLKNACVYSELKQAAPLYLIELRLCAEVELDKKDMCALIQSLNSFRQLCPKESTKKYIKNIVKKLGEAI